MNRFHEGGRNDLFRKTGTGRPRKREDLIEEKLLRSVLAGATANGFETDLWTVGPYRRDVTGEFQIQLSKSTIWRRLRDAGLTYQMPEREYYEIDDSTRKQWPRYEVPKICQAVEKHRLVHYSARTNPIFC